LPSLENIISFSILSLAADFLGIWILDSREIEQKGPIDPKVDGSIKQDTALRFMAKRKSSNMWNSGRSSKKTSRHKYISESAAEKLFTEIADEDGVATMEGISVLCEKLDLDPLEDIRVLVLLWKLGANDKPAQISKEEWMAGCNKLNVDSIIKFTNLLPSLDTGFLDQEEFKSFYKVSIIMSSEQCDSKRLWLKLWRFLAQFCFQFNREGTHKTLDKELVVMMLRLVFKDNSRIHQDRLESFIQFLEQAKQYQRITLDQWTSFYDFCMEVEDLSCYDEAVSAWPVMIDEYVEFMEEQQK
jgi:hypothetical protein